MQVNKEHSGEKIKNCLHQPCFFNLLMILRHGKVKKKTTGWVGYKVHFTEGCDSDQPHLLLEVTTTLSTTADGEVMEDLHERLAEKQLLPNQHLVDTGYVDAENIAKSQQDHQIDLV